VPARREDEEHDAGDERHVVARDRQHVADTGNEHGVEHAAGQRVALAGDEPNFPYSKKK
jgi:general stress protein YciG